MDIFDEIRRRGGVVRTRTLREAGYGRGQIERALPKLIRPRHGWLALRNADQELIFAARHGVVIGCISQARRLGLWVSHEDRPHVNSLTPHRQRPRMHARVHWNRPLIPRHPDALVDRIENTLATVVACQPKEHAIAVIESALNKQLITYTELTTLPMSQAAKDIVAACSRFSDSGLESLVRTRLRWLRVPIRQQVWLFGHRVDFLIGERLVLQIDGGHHVGAQRDSDIRHDALLHRHGYVVIRVSYRQVMDEWPETQDLILGAIARDLHSA